MQGYDWYDCSRTARPKRRPARAFRPWCISNELEGRVVPATLTLSPTTLPDDTLGTAYNQTISATGGTTPYTFTVTTGTLPGGLNLDQATGAITGTPNATGTSSFTITATDNASDSGSQAYSVTINTAYSQQLATNGGTGTPTFAVTTGALPTGLTLSPAGLLSGTPTTAGSSSFTVTATDTAGATANQQYTFAVNPALTFTTTTLPGGNVGTVYSQQLATTGGTGTPTFAVTTGTLPAGLTLSPAGLLSGTPTTTGSSSFAISATDINGATTSQNYTLAINAASGITLSPTTLPNATSGAAYSQQLAATGGTSPFTFAVTTGSLPAGLTLSADGLISGTPTATGTSTFTVTATDSANATGTQDYTLTVNAASPITLSPTTLPNGTVGTPYGQLITGTGGAGTLTFAVTTGALPAGLTLANTGAITGTPTTAGTSTFTVTATDTAGATGTQDYTLTINAVTGITLSPTTLPNATVGTTYSQQITGTGGTGTLSFAVTTGTLPAGLTLSSAGLLSGTPTTAGTSTFTVTATDTAGATANQQYTLDVTSAATTGPTVTNLQRFGFHTQPTMFVLTFSAPLDAASAQNINNYTLVPISGGQPGAAIPLASAVYSAANNTVTLNPVSPVYAYGQYQLTVNGTAPDGIKDAAGHFLAGANGQSGTNYVQTFGMEIIAGPNLPTGTSAAAAHRINSRWAHQLGPRFHLGTRATGHTSGTATATHLRNRRVVVRTARHATTFAVPASTLVVDASSGSAATQSAAVDAAIGAIMQSQRHRK